MTEKRGRENGVFAIRELIVVGGVGKQLKLTTKKETRATH